MPEAELLVLSIDGLVVTAAPMDDDAAADRATRVLLLPGLDELHQPLRRAGVKVLDDPVEAPAGRLAHTRDPGSSISEWSGTALFRATSPHFSAFQGGARTMPDLELEAATYRYDITRALFEGTVEIDGFQATFETASIVSDNFERMVPDRAYDVSGLRLTFYLRALGFDDPPFAAVPMFPTASSAIRRSLSTRRASTVPRTSWATVGEFATYGHDAGVVAKGIVSDDRNVRSCREANSAQI